MHGELHLGVDVTLMAGADLPRQEAAAACCLLPAACCLLPAACCLLCAGAVAAAGGGAVEFEQHRWQHGCDCQQYLLTGLTRIQLAVQDAC
jgi:hypothetical protein